MSITAVSGTRGSTVYASGKLIGVLRKPTHSRASSNSSPATSSAREEELQSAIRQLRIQDGDDGYKKSPRMSSTSTSTSTSQSGSNSESTSTSISASSGLNALDDSWRKDGREKRRIILEDDNSNGGSDFHINHQSPLRTYSAIADRVSSELNTSTVLFYLLNFKMSRGNKIYPCSTALLYSTLLCALIRSQSILNHIYYINYKRRSEINFNKLMHPLEHPPPNFDQSTLWEIVLSTSSPQSYPHITTTTPDVQNMPGYESKFNMIS